MNLGGRGRRHSTRNLLLYGFVLLSIAFFVFVFLNMPVSGDIPKAFGDMQTHFVSTKSMQTFSKKDRPARFRSQHDRLSGVPRSSTRPWGLKDPEAEERARREEEEERRLEDERRQEEKRQEEERRQEEEERRQEERRAREEESRRREDRDSREEEDRNSVQDRRGERQEDREAESRKKRVENRQGRWRADEDVGLVDAINKRAGVETAEQRKQSEMKRRQEETSRTIPKSTLQIALTSAFRGDRYAYMAKLSRETKLSYAKIHGYTYYEDNDLISESSSWNQRSAIRTKAIMVHLDDYDWVYWSDVDVFITNPNVKLESLLRSGAHVILSRDWGDRQVNPGSMLMKSSDFSRRFIQEWERAIEEVTDDLRAFEKVMRDHPDWEGNQVVYIPQQQLNPYHHVEVNDQGELFEQPRPHKDGHDLWKEDSLLVHIVNCLRTSRNDCQALGDYYYSIAAERFERLGFALPPL